MDFDLESVRTLSTEALECQEELRVQKESVSEHTTQLQGLYAIRDADAVTTVQQKIDGIHERIAVLEATERDVTNRIAALFSTAKPTVPNRFESAEPDTPPRATAPSSEVIVLNTSSQLNLPTDTSHYPYMLSSSQHQYPVTSLTPRHGFVD